MKAPCAFSLALLAILLVGATGASAQRGSPDIKNVVLVHGAATDGSGWRGGYEVLTQDGYQVTVVQEPLTGLADDVAATKRVLERQEGSVILVGHSYGGTIITVAGAHPKVRALVYVAALQPDIGETTGRLAASIPGDAPQGILEATPDGFLFVDPRKFPTEVAGDIPAAEASFMAHSQMPVAAAAFDTPLTVAAWHDKPSYGVIATDDRELNPKLARWMYRRSGRGPRVLAVIFPGRMSRDF